MIMRIRTRESITIKVYVCSKRRICVLRSDDYALKKAYAWPWMHMPGKFAFLRDLHGLRNPVVTSNQLAWQTHCFKVRLGEVYFTTFISCLTRGTMRFRASNAGLYSLLKTHRFPPHSVETIDVAQQQKKKKKENPIRRRSSGSSNSLGDETARITSKSLFSAWDVKWAYRAKATK